MNASEFKKRVLALVAAMVLLAWGMPAQAISMKECSVKYKAAQAAGSAASWNEFRKQQCAKDISATPAPESDAAVSEMKTEAAAKDAQAAGDTKSLVFPSAVSSKFAAEKPAKARMHTCLEQYHINKDNNALGGTKWIQKGGGYYKLCNDKLKGKT
ncbi:hypothetical protein [Phyllobacterium sp. P30BS-XVII]|uniref:hypothetical protein n=1 Tax=Phyllobacterium sp. P30BS-XVII TaxID=2587046 RepID=UPI0018056A38|nr:hypothetical protein [Phyllobacterium sp. P30BS-XVII]MBA8901261.1 hypothetical protein [Phyllobacterium sp. P30BS-XVII]